MASSQTTSDAYPAEFAVGVTSSRITQVSAAARAVHRQILHGFAATGRAPGKASLTAPDGADLDALLHELHDHDVIQLAARGAIRAAYPFSGIPTAHRVAIDAGPTVYAMCAIDALGISAMLHRDTTITTTDPTSHDPITVTVRSGQAVWRPETAVAFVGSDTTVSAAGCCTPSDIAAADRCCGVMNLFITNHNAQAWMTAHPHIAGTMLSKEQALRLGIDIFGPLLDD